MRDEQYNSDLKPESTEFTNIRVRVDAQFRALEHIHKLSYEISQDLTGDLIIDYVNISKADNGAFIPLINSRLNDADSYLNLITVTLEHLKSKI